MRGAERTGKGGWGGPTVWPVWMEEVHKSMAIRAMRSLRFRSSSRVLSSHMICS